MKKRILLLESSMALSGYLNVNKKLKRFGNMAVTGMQLYVMLAALILLFAATTANAQWLTYGSGADGSLSSGFPYYADDIDAEVINYIGPTSSTRMATINSS